MRRALVTSASAALASALVADAVDRRRIAADPLWERLRTPPEAEQRTVRGAGGTPLHVELSGPADAPPVVLVHGWTCSTVFWRLQVHELAADHRVVAYDLRGHGRSGTPADGDWSLDTLADDLEAVLVECVGDERPALLAGHSLGGMTIAAWAGRYNDAVGPRAKGAVLVNTGLGDLIQESLVLRMPGPLGRSRQVIGTAMMAAPGALPPRPHPVMHRAVRAIALSRSAGPAAVRVTEEMFLACHPRARAACGRELSRLDLLHTVEHLNTPTLVIAGRRDRLTPPPHAHRLAEALPQSRGVLELDCGHMGPLERPAEVNRALRQLA